MMGLLAYWESETGNWVPSKIEEVESLVEYEALWGEGYRGFPVVVFPENGEDERYFLEHKEVSKEKTLESLYKITGTRKTPCDFMGISLSLSQDLRSPTPGVQKICGIGENFGYKVAEWFEIFFERGWSILV